MEDEKFCTAATSTTSVNSLNTERDEVNLQLDSWKIAIGFYENKILTNNFNSSDKFQILRNLGDSLITLFGMNYDGKNSNSIQHYINNYFPNKKNIKLSKDNLGLYNDLIYGFGDKYRSISRHFTIKDTKALHDIDRNDIVFWYKTVQKTWVWFLEKLYEEIPKEQLECFAHDFR